MAQAHKLARAHEPALIRFELHPLLDEYATIWTPQGPLRPRAARPRTDDVARKEVASRERQALEQDAAIGAALAKVPWSSIGRLPASASRDRLLLHKVKGLRLSGWDRTQNRRGCPHCPTPTQGIDLGHTYHIMWYCGGAQALWRQLRASWERLGGFTEATDADFRDEVFSLRLRQTPAIAWSFIGLRGVPTELIPHVHAVVALVWQQQVLGCFSQIWRWRQSTADDTLPWTLAVASSALRGALRAAFYQVSSTLQQSTELLMPLQRLLHGLQRQQLEAEPEVPRSARHASDQFLLFFDGGSRGNPGPGGAGAVIVRVDAYGGRPHVVWAAAMSLASPTTTNNQAEYVGLVTGLRYASAKRLQPLTVIGDSAMIITQLRDHRAPKNDALRILYGQARIMADVHRVTKWRHHVRAYNKMADCAANLAMDSKRSVQTLHPTARPMWSELRTFLAEDVAQWQASTHPGLTSVES